MSDKKKNIEPARSMAEPVTKKAKVVVTEKENNKHMKKNRGAQNHMANHASSKEDDDDAMIPLAKQSEIRVMHASSHDGSHPLESVLVEESSTFWKSKDMSRKKDRTEQYVQFQLAPNKQVRRVGSVEVFELKHSCNDYRLDYSMDGTTWKRGYSLWGLESYGFDGFGIIRANVDLGNLKAKFVRIVCEKPSRSCSGVGFAFVEFNRVAQMQLERD